MEQAPRLTSIAGVSRALIGTVGVQEAVVILIAQFGWDVAFSALAHVDSPEACAALWAATEQLMVDESSS